MKVDENYCASPMETALAPLFGNIGATVSDWHGLMKVKAKIAFLKSQIRNYAMAQN